MTAQWRVLIAFGLLVQACAHVFSAALSGFVIGVIFVGRAGRGRRALECARVALMGLPAMTVFALSMMGQRGLARVAFSSEIEWEPLRARLTELPRIVVPGPAVRGWLALALVLVALGSAGVRWRRRTLGHDEGAVAFASAILLLFGVAAPLNLPGWQYFAPRFVPLACLLALTLVPIERLKGLRARALTVSATTAVASISLFVSARFHQRVASGCAEALSGLDAPLRRTFLQLPVVLDAYCGVAAEPSESEVPYLAPLQHAGALYAVAHGGSVPYLFEGSAAIHAFRSRKDPTFVVPIPPVDHYWALLASDPFVHDPAVRGRVLTELAAFGMPYEDVLLFGARPDDEAAWLARGYLADWQKPSLLIARFRGCSLGVALPAAAARERPRLGLGPWPIDESSVDIVIPVPSPDAPDIVTLPLKHMMCGDMWIRVDWSADGSAGRRTCAGADREGRLRFHLAGDDGRIECQPTAPRTWATEP
jgi:hypothetical protein